MFWEVETVPGYMYQGERSAGLYVEKGNNLKAGEEGEGMTEKEQRIVLWSLYV